MKPPIRVLVVDDSALMRKLIPQILAHEHSIEVVGTAMDGNFGLKKIAELKPQVITLDLEMPGMGGLDMLKQIMRHHRLPVIVVSSHPGGTDLTLKALSYGAFDCVAKPHDVSSRMPEIARELIDKIKAAAESRATKMTAIPEVESTEVAKSPLDAKKQPTRIVAIGVSTGGPQALQYVLSQLPHSFPASIVVVQHMPEGFTEMFARRLDQVCSLSVKHAQSGDLLLTGRVLVCPGSHHIKVKRLPLGNIVVLNDEDRVKGHRPSVDVLFKSLAEEFGSDGLAVIMTGMGEDGADGMGLVKASGGVTIAQDEESCVVYGMPKAAIERGYANRVVPLNKLANNLQAMCAPQRTSTPQSGDRRGAGAGRG
jgi:two-component system chemotaxis response regulator CheB